MSSRENPVTSEQVTRRSLLIGSAALLGAGAAFGLQPRRTERALGKLGLATLVPKAVGPWRFVSQAGLVDTSEQAEGPEDGYDQVVGRVYQAAGAPSIMLLVAYGNSLGGSLVLHRPDSCYPAQGFRLHDFHDTDLRFDTIGPVHARGFSARRDDRVERVLYWTRVSRAFPRNSFDEYLAILRSVAAGLVPDGVLVRFSTIGGDIPASDRAIGEFASALVTDLSPTGRQILLGR
jgi:EpsI family protein